MKKLVLIMFLNPYSAFAVNGSVEKARTTVYNTPKYKDVNGQRTKCAQRAMTDSKGKVLAKLCSKQFANCQMQGSCVVDGPNGRKVLNVNGSGGWSEVKNCKYGTGAMVNGKRSCLIPYKTLACGNKKDAGKVIHIPEAVGKHYSVDGGPTQVHDGNFICADTGGAIKGKGRFDLFTGYAGEGKNELLNLGFEDVNNGKIHYAEVNGGKMRDDDLLIQNLQQLVLTNGDRPANSAYASNDSPAAR